MKYFVRAALAGASLAALLGITACSQREPSDAQLAMLLGTGKPGVADVSGQLDVQSIDCLRSLSGDAELAKNLPADIAGEGGKRACPHLLESRLSDAQRNPAQLKLDEVTPPKVVRRALALQSARRLAALDGPNAHQPPPALANAAPALPAAADDPSVDLGASGEKLKEAENLCQEVQRRLAAKDDIRLRGFANYCGTALKRARSSMVAVAKKGNTVSLEAMGTTAGNIATNAKRLLDSPAQ